MNLIIYKIFFYLLKFNIKLINPLACPNSYLIYKLDKITSPSSKNLIFPPNIPLIFLI